MFESIIKSNKKVFFWFRDDDGNVLNDKFKRLVEFFEVKKCTLLESIIPFDLDSNIVDYIKMKDNIYIGQHGYTHIDYSIDKSVKSELCSSRDIETVISEQKIGNCILEEAFGEKYTHVYVPPFFEIEDVIKNKLIGLGIYNAFSIWWSNSMINMDIPEINVQIDFVDWNFEEKFAGERYVNSQIERELKGICDNSCLDYGIIGIVLHHNLMCDDDYVYLSNLLCEIFSCKNTEVITIYEALALVKNMI